MNRIRLWLGYGGLSCVVLAAVIGGPPLLDRGSDALLSYLMGDCRAQREYTELLEARREVITHRIRLTDEIRAALIAGQLTLPEAADRLLAVNADLPPDLRTPLDHCPGDCDAERACHFLLGRVRADLDRRYSPAPRDCAAEDGEVAGPARP
jgi:hypothetical protein